MGLTAFRNREKRAAELAAAPKAVKQLTEAERSDLRREECLALRAENNGLRSRVAELEQQVESLTAPPAASQATLGLAHEQGRRRRG